MDPVAEACCRIKVAAIHSPLSRSIGMSKDIWLASLAMLVYIFGGLATFAGIILIILMKGRDLWGLGDGSSFGYLLVCVGLLFSILGVAVMRFLRNR
jgi:hypothetical protein